MILKEYEETYKNFMQRFEELTGKREYFYTSTLRKYDTNIHLTLLENMTLKELTESMEKKLGRKLKSGELEYAVNEEINNIANEAYRLIDEIIEVYEIIKVENEGISLFNCERIDAILKELHVKFSGYKEDDLMIYEGYFLGQFILSEGDFYRYECDKSIYKKTYYKGDVNNNNIPNGRGNLFWFDGTLLYEGEFNNGNPNGLGIEYYRDSNMAYRGLWKLGNYHGRGCEYTKSGEIMNKGIYNNGYFIGGFN